ncbi:MAG: DUF5343 domain-containing protein [Dehalococcoidia bacterium]
MNGKGRKHLPPYVSYRTFENFVDGLQQGVPARIDRSYWGDRLSGSTGTQLMSALRFLALVDANGTPTNQLKLLASSKGSQRAEILKQLATESFGFLMQSPFNLQSSTYAQLQEAFHEAFGLTDDVNRKCVKFFVEFVKAAGIPLSPFIVKRVRSMHGAGRNKIVTAKVEARTIRKSAMAQAFEETPLSMSWGKMLLAKFPTFDPTWTDEVKLKWFEAFDKLAERDLSAGKK